VDFYSLSIQTYPCILFPPLCILYCLASLADDGSNEAVSYYEEFAHDHFLGLGPCMAQVNVRC
jgi:hypothetical protein